MTIKHQNSNLPIPFKFRCFPDFFKWDFSGSEYHEKYRRALSSYHNRYSNVYRVSTMEGNLGIILLSLVPFQKPNDILTYFVFARHSTHGAEYPHLDMHFHCKELKDLHKDIYQKNYEQFCEYYRITKQ